MSYRDVVWQDDAACKGMDTNLFYLDDSRIKTKVCSRCPVATQCLNEALRHEAPGSRDGVWGGMSASDRKREYDGISITPATHCSLGHELTPENIINHGRGSRRCKTCSVEIGREPRQRTHCANGHEWTEENVAVRGSRRFCRPCERDNTRKYAQRVKEQHEAASNHHQRQQVREAV